MKTVIKAATILATSLLATSSSGGTTAPAEITFGIVPQQSASRLAKMWGPFLAELSERTGVTVRFRTTKDIPTFESCLAAGAYDLAYMNPMHYAIFSKESDYQAIARQTKKKLKGVIVAHKDGAVRDLSALQGETVAFPSPGAFGASILTRATLSSNDVTFEPAYVKSHDSVYRSVAAGLMAAGGGVVRTFNAVDPEIREQLMVIHETDAYTPHAFAAHQGIAPELRSEVQNALMQIANEHQELVSGIGMNGLEVAADEDWDDVRALGMSREETGIAQGSEIACPSD